MPPVPPQLTLLTTPARPIVWRGKQVNPVLVERAESVLADFNRQAASNRRPYKANGSPSDSLSRILGAVVAFPDVRGSEWHAVIERALDNPWWTGTASVGAVFGPRVVERYLFPAREVESLDAARRRKTGERRARQRASMRMLRGDFNDDGSVGDHLPAS